MASTSIDGRGPIELTKIAITEPAVATMAHTGCTKAVVAAVRRHADLARVEDGTDLVAEQHDVGGLHRDVGAVAGGDPPDARCRVGVRGRAAIRDAIETASPGS